MLRGVRFWFRFFPAEYAGNNRSVSKVGERFNLRVCSKVCLQVVKVNPNRYLRAAVPRERRVPYRMTLGSHYWEEE